LLQQVPEFAVFFFHLGDFLCVQLLQCLQLRIEVFDLSLLSGQCCFCIQLMVFAVFLAHLVKGLFKVYALLLVHLQVILQVDETVFKFFEFLVFNFHFGKLVIEFVCFLVVFGFVLFDGLFKKRNSLGKLFGLLLEFRLRASDCCLCSFGCITCSLLSTFHFTLMGRNNNLLFL
jgi:hypothetical protein